jgi:hypothetical protein
MPAPPALTSEQASYWSALVDRLAWDRFDPGDQPLLVELCRAQSRSCKVNEALDQMRQRILISDTPTGGRQRRIFGQLLKMAQAESHTVMMLCTKLRIGDQSRTRKVTAEARDRMAAAGPRPWDVGPRDESAGQH